MDWSKVREKIGDLGRICLHCSSYQVGSSLFCQSCETLLWSRHQCASFFKVTKGITGRQLFDWYPDEDRLVSRLMMSLKQGKPETAFSYYAEKFFIQSCELSLHHNSVFVPCAWKQQPDHAFVFAQKLSEAFAIPMKDILKWKGAPETQKLKRFWQRNEVEFEPSEEASGKHVIFIDDILTTGATAVAARKALKGCSGFEVWCLAHRRLSRDPSKVLGTLP